MGNSGIKEMKKMKIICSEKYCKNQSTSLVNLVGYCKSHFLFARLENIKNQHDKNSRTGT